MRHARTIAVIAAATLLATSSAVAQPAVRWLIIIDDLHLDFANTGHVRTLVKTIAAELIRDGDQFALYSTGPSSVAVPWTYDRHVVDNVVKKIAGNSLRLPDILASTQGLTPTNEAHFRATVALTRVNEIVASLDPALDRRTGIIYVSDGYVDRPPLLARDGQRVRMPIFAIDPRLLPDAVVNRAGVDDADWSAYWAATRASLRALSEQSGGLALAEGEDLAATLARISDFVRR